MDDNRYSFFPPLRDSTATEGTVEGTSPVSELSSSIYSTTSAPGATPISSTTSPGKDTSVFNISWGGSNDKPPLELHREEITLSAIPTKPLPKPRGVRRLPEPEPGEDGSLDEDTLKRRKNTHAARKSRLKKLLHIEHLENQIKELQSENAQLVLNNAILESEKKSMAAREQEYKKRIQYLEEVVRMSCHGVGGNTT